MSPTEKPIIPRPQKPVSVHDGIAEWRPLLTSLTVHDVGAERHIVVWRDCEEFHRFRLSAEQCAALAALLASKPVGAAA